MKTKFMLLCFILFSFPQLKSQDAEAAAALLVIDVQEEFTRFQMDSLDANNLIRSINDIIQRARPMEIIFVQADMKQLNISFKGIKIESAKHLELDRRLSRKENDLVFLKKESSAFTLLELNSFLEEREIEHLYIVGLMLGQCVSNTAIDAAQRAYSVSVIKEGTRARKASKAFKLLKVLENSGVKVISISEFERLFI